MGEREKRTAAEPTNNNREEDQLRHPRSGFILHTRWHTCIEARRQMELPTSPIRGARTPMEAPATPSGSSSSTGAPSLLTSHPLVDYLLSLEEGGSLTPQVLNLLFAAVRFPAPTQSSSVTLCASTITLDLMFASIVHTIYLSPWLVHTSAVGRTAEP